MRGRRLGIRRLKQLLVAFAALGMLIGVRPASSVRGHLHLKPASLLAADPSVGLPFELASAESGPAASPAQPDVDEDGSDESDVESTDSLELERNVVGRMAPARSRPPLLATTPPVAVQPASPGHLRPIAAPAIPGGLPVFLCRLTC